MGDFKPIIKQALKMLIGFLHDWLMKKLDVWFAESKDVPAKKPA